MNDVTRLRACSAAGLRELLSPVPPPELLVAQRGRPRAPRHLRVVQVVVPAVIVVVHVRDGGAGDALEVKS